MQNSKKNRTREQTRTTCVNRFETIYEFEVPVRIPTYLRRISLFDLLSMSRILTDRINGNKTDFQLSSLVAQKYMLIILEKCGDEKGKLINQLNIINLLIQHKNSIENRPTKENIEKFKKILEEFES